MPLLQVVLILIAVGVLNFLVKKTPYIDETWKQIVYWASLFGTVVFIGGLFGLWSHLSAIHIGR